MCMVYYQSMSDPEYFECQKLDDLKKVMIFTQCDTVAWPVVASRVKFLEIFAVKVSRCCNLWPYFLRTPPKRLWLLESSWTKPVDPLKSGNWWCVDYMLFE